MESRGEWICNRGSAIRSSIERRQEERFCDVEAVVQKDILWNACY